MIGDLLFILFGSLILSFFGILLILKAFVTVHTLWCKITHHYKRELEPEFEVVIARLETAAARLENVFPQFPKHPSFDLVHPQKNIEGAS
jgi:uncharacterized membrane protein